VTFALLHLVVDHLDEFRDFLRRVDNRLSGGSCEDENRSV
jgi:hypothetical protein